MLDVHPPHHPVHAWRDFFIHIATISVGLLIAVGLEQTVEYIHHRKQVAEAHEALRRELEDNIKRFDLETANVGYAVPALRGDLATFLYLREHPNAPAAKWPFPIHGEVLTPIYTQGAWRAIQQSGVIEHLPQIEISHNDRMYTRLAIMNDIELRKRDALFNVQMGFAAESAAASSMTPAEIEQEIHALEVLLSICAEGAWQQRNISRYTSEFKNPPAEEFSVQGRLLHWPGAQTPDPEYQKSLAEYVRIEQRLEEEYSKSGKGDR